MTWRCALLAWWFIYIGGYNEPRVVGPFATAAACETVRHARDQRATVPGATKPLSYPCFSDGS